MRQVWKRNIGLMGVLVALLFGMSGGVAAETVPAHWHPTTGLTWQIQLSAPLSGDPLPVQVYDLDGFDTDAETVSMLKSRGIHAICYVDMGTWEEWRPDAGDYPDAVIGKAWDEWPGERYLDIRQLDTLAPILEARLDLCAAKGFDAVDPDNIDTYGTETGFPLTESDQLRFNRWLAEAAHARGLAIGQKNAPELTADLVQDFDFAVTEDCLADGWCDEMVPYTDANKAVLAIEYTDRMSEQAFAAECVDAELPLSLVLKRRELDEWRVGCS